MNWLVIFDQFGRLSTTEAKGGSIQIWSQNSLSWLYHFLFTQLTCQKQREGKIWSNSQTRLSLTIQCQKCPAHSCSLLIWCQWWIQVSRNPQVVANDFTGIFGLNFCNVSLLFNTSLSPSRFYLKKKVSQWQRDVIREQFIKFSLGEWEVFRTSRRRVVESNSLWKFFGMKKVLFVVSRK